MVEIFGKKGRKKKEPLLLQQQREIDDDNVFWAKFKPPVDLYLISEKSIWKNQVWRTGFLGYF